MAMMGEKMGIDLAKHAIQWYNFSTQIIIIKARCCEFIKDRTRT